MPRVKTCLLVLLLLSLALLGAQCAKPAALIVKPAWHQLSLPGEVDVLFYLWPPLRPDSVQVELAGDAASSDVTAQLHHFGRLFWGRVDVATPGEYAVRVSANGPTGEGLSNQEFEIVDLPDADQCEVLNSAECLLPFPSDRFLQPDPSKPNGVQMVLPALGLSTSPPLNPPTDPSPWLELDGFSPTAPILMNFPAGVDLVASGVDRLIPPDPIAPQTRPYSGVRTHAGTSLLPGSPTVLLDATTGERVLHFVELDTRASNPARQALILRPAVALEPGHRYVVAVRKLVDPSGALVEAEPAFRALRDRLPTTIPAIESRRWHFEREIFEVLEDAYFTVPRKHLQLAFDFTVQSDAGLTADLLSMQEQAYAWLEDQVDAQGNQTFSVKPFGANASSSQQFDCSVPGTSTWRILRGTYQVPLFLTQDLANALSVGFLSRDAAGVPLQNGVTQAVFSASIPCAAKNAGAPADHGIVLGHGLFGTGDGIVQTFAGGFAEDTNYASAATDFRGLSQPDLGFVALRIVGLAGVNQFNNFPALVDRLKQGQVNTLLLARMLKRGDFNVDPAFQVSPGVGGMPDADDELFYFGASLGGIMGTFFAALTPDVQRFNLDVPGMTFALLLQRSTQYTVFEGLLAGVGLSEPLDVLISLSLQHELWVRGEPAGFVHRLAPQVASGEKRVLVTAAWLDKQVSNQASEILARTLGAPSLEGSVMEGLVGIPDVTGPVDSAFVIYDTGTYDIYDPSQAPFIPPLANRIPSSVCDPHPVRATVPASVDQLITFLQPGGQIENFCDGVCDGTTPYEQPAAGACVLP